MFAKTQRLLAIVSVLVLTFCICCPTALAEDALTEGDFTYTVADDKATITGYSGGSSELVIPSTIGGLPVVKVQGFKGCNMVSLVIPDSVESIGASAFANCENLRSLDLGAGVTEIGGNAFSGDAALAGHLRLPPKLATIYARAFERCTGITSVWIPKSLGDVPGDYGFTTYHHPFSGCSGLKEVAFEEGITYIPARILAEVGGITTFTVPDGVRKIGDGAFRNCENLKSVRFPDELSEIDSGAFASCPKLTSVVLPSLLKTLGNNAFWGCDALADVYAGKKIVSVGNASFDHSHTVVHVSKYTDSTKSLVDAEHEVLFTDSNLQDSDAKIVKPGKSYYEVNDSAASAYLVLKLGYALKSAKAAQATNQILRIKIPKSATLYDIRKDGVSLSDEGFNVSGNNLVTIPVSGNGGNYSFYVTPNDHGRMNSYAALTYTLKGESNTEIIGAIGSDCTVLTMGTNDEASFKSGASSVPLRVSGFGRIGEDVELFVDGKLAKEVTVSNAGMYGAEVSLPAPEDGREYTVCAKSVNAQGKDVSVEKTVSCYKDAPQLTKFQLYIEAHDYEGGHATFDLLDESKGMMRYITYQPKKPYRFTVDYANRDQIRKVFVVSTRGGESKRLEAKWSDADKAYVTSGYFGDNSSYVPGNLSVEYTTKLEPSDSSKNDAVALTAREKASVPSDWRNATTEVIERSEDGFSANITLASGDEVNYSFTKLSFKDYAAELEAGQGGSDDALTTQAWEDPDEDRVKKTQMLIELLKALDPKDENCMSEFVKAPELLLNESYRYYRVGGGDLKGDAIAFVKSDMTSDQFAYYFIDPSADENYVGKYVIKKVSKKTEKSMYELFGMDSDLGSYSFKMGKEAIKFEGQAVNLAMKKLEIMSDPSLTESERAAQLAQLDKMKEVACEKLVFTYLATTLSLLAATSSVTGVGIAFGVLAVIIDKAIIPMVESGDFDKFLEGKLSLRSMMMHWLIDPSGYVYEGVTSNRVSDATVTVFYREDEADKTVKQWKAEDYAQQNPLQTDDEGNYSWNVPEGLWQVRASKEGYETAVTEWLPVPPPQMDVKIKLNNLAHPEVETAVASKDSVRISFSQYMDPQTVGGIKVLGDNGKALAYRLVYSTNETDAVGNVYAKDYLLHFSEARPSAGSMVTLSGIAEAKSSSGVAAQGEDCELAVGNGVHLTCVDDIKILPGTTYTLDLKITGYAGQKVSLNSNAKGIMSVSDVGEMDASGHMTAVIHGNVLGDAVLTVAIEGTGIKRAIPVSVCDEVSTGQEYDDDAEPIDISGFPVSLAQDSFPYDGAAKTPAVGVEGPQGVLCQDIDFTVAYQDNVEPGMASVVITGIDNYTGAIRKEFQIVADSQQPVAVRGDVNGDGDVTMADVVKANRYVMGKATLADFELAAADVNGDGDVTMADVVRMNRYVMGKIDTL